MTTRQGFIRNICVMMIASLLTITLAGGRSSGQTDIRSQIETHIQDLGGPNGDAAANALVRIGTPAVKGLIFAFDNPDAAVRMRAAEVIGKIRDYTAIRPLQKPGRDFYASVQKAAVLALLEHLAVESFGVHGEPIGQPKTYAPLVELGARAVEPLLSVLGGNDDRIRIPAIAALGAIRDRRALKPLAQLLDDQNEWVVGAAAKALTNFNDPQVVPVLLTKLDRIPPDYGVSPVHWALVEMGDRATRPLIAALYGDDPKVVEGASAVLLERGDYRAVSALLDVLNDPGSPVVKALVHSSKPLKDTRWVPVLVELAYDRNAEVSQFAVRELGHLRDRRAVPLLLEALSATSPTITATAAGSLGTLRDHRAVPDLISLLDDPAEAVRKEAAEALGNIGDFRARKPLFAALRSPDPKLAITAAAALGRMRVSGAAEAILQVGAQSDEADSDSIFASTLADMGDAGIALAKRRLRDPSMRIRRIAAWTLNDAKDPKSGPLLMAALADKDTEVRYAATSALGELGDVGATAPLMRMLNDPDAGVRSAACGAVGKLKAAAAVDALIKQLSDADANVSEAARTSLAQIGKPAAQAVLRLIDSPSDGLRLAGVRTLSDWNDPAYADSLAKCLDDKADRVRIEATLALGRLNDQRALRPLGALARNSEGWVRKEARDRVMAMAGWIPPAAEPKKAESVKP